ncbi:MAG: peroxiredoxin [Aigarchaeota archaeon]|nr:peroxiredoxin [Aigarchaeota archaeon]MDW8092279.1 peroxiredoxin [Nitrososphaerota archaeon]
MPQVGDIAPDFMLPNQDGHLVKFSDIYKKSGVVLFFYPKDGSPGCTREACGMRDAHGELGRLGYAVVGVSADTVRSHKMFAERNSLPYLLLSDPTKKVAEMYDALSLFKVFVRRVTYVIDKGGTIKFIYKGLNPSSHVREVLNFIKRDLSQRSQQGTGTS